MDNDNIVEKLIGIRQDYIAISPEEFKDGHGGGLSVKVVLPCYCQARCSFCFNNMTFQTQKHDYAAFFDNLPKTLDMIFNNITGRPISLDITGNEPTFDVEVFSRFMKIIKKYKSKIEKIVLTTNGYKLEQCLNDMTSVVDIVNISVHHYDYTERQNIFNTPCIPSDESLKRIIEHLKKVGTTCTAVAVLYSEIKNFDSFYENFVNWAIDLGFKDSRMRSNFCSSDDFFDEILNANTEFEKMNKVAPLTTKIIKEENTGFKTYILKGIPDLTKYILGVELVVDDNGFCYIDYNKRYPVNDLNIEYFNNIYTYNKFSDNVLPEKGNVLRKMI